MRRGELGQGSHDTNGYLWGLEGMVVMVKVMGLLAGYAIFVWMTMTQMERRYLAPLLDIATADRESVGQSAAVPGAVVIQGRPATLVSESVTPSRTVPHPSPGRSGIF